MTDEMLALARKNAAEAGVTNAHFLKGVIEQIPLPADSVDVVISNCVINLSVDKAAVLTEMARVLKPGGRIGVSDVVAEDHLTHGRAGRTRQLCRLHRRCAFALGVCGGTRGSRFRGRVGRVHARGRGRDARCDRQGDEDARAGHQELAGRRGRSARRLLLSDGRGSRSPVRLRPQRGPQPDGRRRVVELRSGGAHPRPLRRQRAGRARSTRPCVAGDAGARSRPERGVSRSR